MKLKQSPLILDLLKSDTEVFYSRGNSGDHLINAAVKQFLGHRIVDKSKTLVFLGAGGFCHFYKHNIGHLSERLDGYEKIFLISTTIDMSCDEVRNFISSLPGKVTIICRDKKSFFDVSRVHFNTMIDHDAAFYFDYSPYMKHGSGHLNALRIDRESTDIAIPEGNVDVSALNDYEKLLEYVSNAESVTTNRLHVAIAATKLGKTVTLCPNGYFKNREVYKTSLINFPNCEFKELL